jgi:hypothetical protein
MSIAHPETLDVSAYLRIFPRESGVAVAVKPLVPCIVGWRTIAA